MRQCGETLRNQKFKKESARALVAIHVLAWCRRRRQYQKSLNGIYPQSSTQHHARQRPLLRERRLDKSQQHATLVSIIATWDQTRQVDRHWSLAWNQALIMLWANFILSAWSFCLWIFLFSSLSAAILS